MDRQILLADDDALVLATFGRGLRDAGYRVSVAASGQEALEVAEKEEPDLAILDIRMPGMSGVEVSREMRRLGIPVIHLTAYDDRETLDAALEEGALGYLVKPIDVSKAIPTIEAALKRAGDLFKLQQSEARLSRALDTANVVNYAVGIISERHRITSQKAFDMIRDRARSERRRVKEIAREILDAAESINRFSAGKQ